MAKVVFALTAAQVKSLVDASKGATNNRADYGSTSGLQAKGWLKEKPRRRGQVGYYYARGYTLTKRGRLVLALVRELKLDRAPPAAPA
jgi:hypothetical protein